MTTTEPLWTVTELATFLGYSPRTVSNLLCKSPGKLPPRVAALTRPRWSAATVQAWAAEQSRAPRAAVGRPRVR